MKLYIRIYYHVFTYNIEKLYIKKKIKRYFFFYRYIIQISLFTTYFGTCSVYAVIVAANFEKVIKHYNESLSEDTIIREITACLLIPLILLSWVPNLKYLAPVSMVANIFMGTGLGITFYYLVWDLPPINTVPLAAPIQYFPHFFSITVFAMEAIGTISFIYIYICVYVVYEY